MGPTVRSPLVGTTAGETAPTGDFAQSGWQPDTSGRFGERYFRFRPSHRLVRTRTTESVDPFGTTAVPGTAEHQLFALAVRRLTGDAVLTWGSQLHGV
jgi:hypothetical protein